MDGMWWFIRRSCPCNIFFTSEWASFITGAELMVTCGFEIGEGPKKPMFHWTTMEKK